MVDFDGHICEGFGRAKLSKFHLDLSLLVAISKDDVQRLPLSQPVYVKLGCHFHQ